PSRIVACELSNTKRLIVPHSRRQRIPQPRRHQPASRPSSMTYAWLMSPCRHQVTRNKAPTPSLRAQSLSGMNLTASCKQTSCLSKVITMMHYIGGRFTKRIFPSSLRWLGTFSPSREQLSASNDSFRNPATSAQSYDHHSRLKLSRRPFLPKSGSNQAF
ncbi:hypothetical protein B0H34DRAFT_321770, partial [Crassisporium funariophilum]